MVINPFVIIKNVEQWYNLEPGVLVGKGKTKTVAEARAVAMFIVRSLTEYSLHEIGNHFNKDHSAVYCACKKIKQREFDYIAYYKMRCSK